MLVLILLGTVFMLWLWSSKGRNKNEPPLGHGSKILFGHALQYAGNSHKLWNTWTKFSHEALERGGIIKTTIGPRTIYVVSGPEDFLKMSNSCMRKDAVYEFARPWVGDGLTISKPSIWKVHRKLLNPAFNQNMLENFMSVFNNQSRCLVQNLNTEVGKGSFDPSNFTQLNSLETVCLAVLGVDFKEKTKANMEFVLALDKIFNLLAARFQKFWLHNKLLFNLSSLKTKQDRCIKTLHEMSQTILKEKKENLSKISNIKNAEEQTQGRKYKPFIEMLLELSREKEVITDLVVREQADTFVAAGSDISGTLITYCLVVVGSYPRVQEKIHEELINMFGDENRDITKQDLSQLVYLEAFIKETLRLYPVVPVIGRLLEEDVTLSNCTLSKGKSAFLSIYGVNRHSMWGPDVDEFRPERWLDASSQLNFSKVFVSFGMGRRNCIGKTFAMTSTKITLAHIFRSYKIHSDHTKLKLKLDVLLKPISGHHISIEKRY